MQVLVNHCNTFFVMFVSLCVLLPGDSHTQPSSYKTRITHTSWVTILWLSSMDYLNNRDRSQIKTQTVLYDDYRCLVFVLYFRLIFDHTIQRTQFERPFQSEHVSVSSKQAVQQCNIKTFKIPQFVWYEFQYHINVD